MFAHGLPRGIKSRKHDIQKLFNERM